MDLRGGQSLWIKLRRECSIQAVIHPPTTYNFQL
jgi:hypothetical protein